MNRAIPKALVALLVAAAPAAAEEVRLSFGAATQWESDIRRGAAGDDLVWQLRPRIALSGDRPRLDYTLEYRPRAEVFTRDSELNEVSHYLFAKAGYQISDRLSLSVSDRFSVVPSIRRLNEGQREAEDEGLVEEGDQLVEGEIATNEFVSNTFSASLNARPFRRVESAFVVSHFFRETDRDDRGTTRGTANRDVVTVRSTLDYLISSRTRAGVGFRWRRNESDRVGPGLTAEDATLVTTSYHVFGSFQYQPDPTTLFSVQAGPTYSEDDREGLDSLMQTVAAFPRLEPERLLDTRGCDRIEVGGRLVPILSPSCEDVESFLGFPQPDLDVDEQRFVAALFRNVSLLPGEERQVASGSNVNVYATLTFRKTWERWTLTARYTRSDSETQGAGSATVLDSLLGSLRWRAASRWEAVASAHFTRRTTEFEQGAPVTVLADDLAIVPGLFHSGGVPFVGATPAGLGTLDSETSFNVDILTLRLRTTRRMSRNLNVYSEVRWRLETAGGDLVRDDSDYYVLRFGFTYHFQAIRL